MNTAFIVSILARSIFRVAAIILFTIVSANAKIVRIDSFTPNTAQNLTLQNLNVQNLNDRALRLSTISPDSALHDAHTALRLALEANNLREQARANAIIGVIFRYQDRYDSALAYQRRARDVFSKIHDTTGLAGSLLNLGGVYQSRGDYASAIDFYFQALVLFEGKNDKRGIAGSRAAIGVVYNLKGEYEQSLQFQRQALTLRLELADEQAIAHSSRNIGTVYERLNNLDSAVWFYKQALERFQRIGNAQGVALTLGSLGSVSERLGKYDDARTYHFMAIPLHERLGDKRGLAVVNNDIAAGFLRQKQHARALQYAETARITAEDIGAWAELRDALKYISDAHTALGNETQAFAAFRRYVVIKDSIENLQNSTRIADLQARYDLARKDRIIAETEHARDIERMDAENFKGSFIAATLVFMLILGLVANGYRIKQHSEKTLRKQNEEILQQQKLLHEQAEEISRTNQDLQATNNLLAEKNEELLNLNIEKSEFLGIAAHDLKNPLANILLTVQLMDEYGTDAPPAKFREWTHGITRGAEYMLNIIRNLLDVNRIEAGKVEMTIERVNAGLVELVADAYTFRASEKNIQLHVEPAPQDAAFLADSNALQQILENLLSNALKFSPSGKNIYIRIKYEGGSMKQIAENMKYEEENMKQREGNAKQEKAAVSSLSPQISSPDFLRIEIQDEGPGVSPEDMKKMFGKFARLSARPTDGEHSTGLGLSIVKKMVEAMNGRVWCESEFGNGLPTGATFIVELPSANKEAR